MGIVTPDAGSVGAPLPAAATAAAAAAVGDDAAAAAKDAAKGAPSDDAAAAAAASAKGGAGAADVLRQPSTAGRGTCTICLEAPSACAFLPCGHLCVCEGCVHLAAAKKQCPVCRSKATGYTRVYAV